MKYLKRTRLVKGTLQERKMVCGNPGCHCHREKKGGHGPYVYLAAVLDGRTRPLLLKKKDVAKVRRYVKGYALLRREIEVVTRRNLTALRQGRLK